MSKLFSDSSLLSKEVAGMKMYSKDNQCMVDVRKLEKKGDDLVMNCKLMGAYSMPIYLRPDELRAALKLLSWDVLSYMPQMLVRGTEAEEAVNDIINNLGDTVIDYIGRAFGTEVEEQARKIGKIMSDTTVDALKLVIEQIASED